MQAAERRQKKTELKREAILRSAAAAFRRKGYHGTSMEDISEQLLMTKGSLYYYFSDKEAILFACHDFSLDRVLEKMREVIEAQKAANSA
ncbi:MAG: helix-turn-helix transcriptional regulator, partial [Planctomycetes bacterium]|nr:helix-turn-helix transcriptional regulator [Planctomycetota bacterium]